MGKQLKNNILVKPASPRHVAIIMDGNGRWAKAQGLPRVEGHRAGAKAVRGIVEYSRKVGIRHLTLFSFSTENWNRPTAEVSALMVLFKKYLESERKLFLDNNIRLRVIGDRTKLPASVVNAIKRSEETTKHCDGLDLILAISYGGREEIVYAARKIAEEAIKGNIKLDEINQELFSKFLYLNDVPEPDLLIRTSNENRISNFLLWQLAYSEIIVSPVCWPDFTQVEFSRCIEEFAARERRFGLTQEQIVQNGAEIKNSPKGASSTFALNGR